MLTEKGEAFQQFKVFKRTVEKEKELDVKCLRTDRGGEFNSKEFNDYCKLSGIKRQLTAAFTPQQNGVAERKNQTVMNMVRCVLTEKKIPKYFWAEAVIWTCYVLNRCPTNALRDVTPQEDWSGVKPSVKHFRVFGCLAHVHVPKEKRRKLDDKNVCCVLLGVSEETKGYRLYDPLTEKIVVSRDVFFEEEKGWDWSEKHQEQILMDLEWEDQSVESNEHADISEGRSENGAVANVLGEATGSEEIMAATESWEIMAAENGNSTAAETSQNQVEGRVNGQNAVDQVEGRDSAENQHEGRVSRAPLWMRDYVDGEDLSEDEAYMEQVAAAEEDPFVYEEAEKEENGDKQWTMK